MRVLYGVTAPQTALAFLEGQLRCVAARGHEVALMCPDDPGVRDFCAKEGATFYPVPIERELAIATEMRAALAVRWAIRKHAPDALIVGTPKMSALALPIARLLRVPHRVYLVHGLRYEGATGGLATLLKILEVASVRLATDSVAVSPSVAAKLAQLPFSRQPRVLGWGSANGVNVQRFVPVDLNGRATARAELGLPASSKVALFVGRLTGDKGLSELLAIADSLDEDELLLVVGGEEPRSEGERQQIGCLVRHARVRSLGHRIDLPRIYAASELLVLPTRREGLPTVLIEAAASGLPVVSYRVTGCVDVVTNGLTGALIDFRSVGDFRDAVLRLLRDAPTARAMGRAGRQDVIARFDSRDVWRHWAEYLDSLPAGHAQ